VEVFDMEAKYKQEVQKYGKKDAIIALCAVLLMIVAATLIVSAGSILAILPIGLGALPFYVQLMAWPVEKIVISIAPVIIIILVMKQGFASIGIHTKNLWRAVRLGLMFSLIPMFFGILPRILYGGEFIGFGLFMVWLVRVFMMAAAEDVLFVGFLQTRLNGLFKSDKVAISIGAALFSFMHIPTWLITGELSFDNLPFFGLMITVWFVMHFVFVAIYRRYNSLIPVTILHTFINFMAYPQRNWIFADEHYGYAESWGATAILVVPVAVGIWAFVRHRRSKKVSV